MLEEDEIRRRLDEYLAIKSEYIKDKRQIVNDPYMSPDEKRKERNKIVNSMRLLNVRIQELSWVLGSSKE